GILVVTHEILVSVFGYLPVIFQVTSFFFRWLPDYSAHHVGLIPYGATASSFQICFRQIFHPDRLLNARSLG
ncbi:MAG: hypothetical protein N6V49_10620, partial [Serratia symbiotica]|nr:hypothetical protein [Serratia symbiotica]